jgi:hypothetical protein
VRNKRIHHETTLAPVEGMTFYEQTHEIGKRLLDAHIAIAGDNPVRYQSWTRVQPDESSAKSIVIIEEIVEGFPWWALIRFVAICILFYLWFTR